VSLSGLEAILSELQEAGVANSEGSLSRRSIKRARDAQTSSLRTDMGSLVQTFRVQLHEPEAPLDVWYIHPARLLQHIASSCSGFSAYLKQLVTNHPSSATHKYNIVVYSDEVSPGNQLRHDNKRKMQAIYWSLKEFGPSVLSDTDCWFLLTVVRSNLVTRMSAGMSELVRRSLQLFFTQPESYFHNGVTVRFTDNSFATLYATLGVMVSDEAALKASLEMKGSSGSFICALCQNIVSHSSRIADHDRSLFLRPSTTTDISQFAMHTDQLIYDTVDMLQLEHGRLGSTAYKKLQRACGFNLLPEGLLLCQELRPIMKPATMLMYDWMHVYVVQGAFNHESGLLLDILKKELQLDHKAIHDYVKTFSWPKQIAANGKSVFEKRSGPVAGSLKCSASEALSVYPVFRRFLRSTVMPIASERVRQACETYMALCDVLDMLRTVVKGSVTSAGLHSAVKRHLDLYLSMYGEDEWFPKLHYALHLGISLEQHGCLFSCFVHERKHKELKRTGNHLFNTSGSFEKTIIQECLYSQMVALSEGSFIFHGPYLKDPKPCKQSLIDALHGVFDEDDGELATSRDVCFAAGKVASERDVVWYDSGVDRKVGQVLFHVATAHCICTCVKPWRDLGDNNFQIEDTQPLLMMSSCIIDTCIYRISGSSAVLA
jgi:hypothetical protein